MGLNQNLFNPQKIKFSISDSVFGNRRKALYHIFAQILLSFLFYFFSEEYPLFSIYIRGFCAKKSFSSIINSVKRIRVNLQHNYDILIVIFLINILTDHYNL